MLGVADRMLFYFDACGLSHQDKLKSLQMFTQHISKWEKLGKY
jgi:hypothetical protein